MNAFLVSVVLYKASLSNALDSVVKSHDSAVLASLPLPSDPPASAGVFSDLSSGSAFGGGYSASNKFRDGFYGDGSSPTKVWAASAGGHSSTGGWTEGGSLSGVSGGSRLGGSWTGADLIGTGSFKDLRNIGPLSGRTLTVRPSAASFGEFGGASSWLSGPSIVASGPGASGGAALNGMPPSTFGSIVGGVWGTQHESSTGTTFRGSNLLGDTSVGRSMTGWTGHRIRGDVPYTGGSFDGTPSTDELRGSSPFGSLSSGKSWSSGLLGDGSVLNGNKLFGSGPLRGQFGGVSWGVSSLGGMSGGTGASRVPEYHSMNGVGGGGMSGGVYNFRWSSTGGASSAHTALSSRHHFGVGLGGLDKASFGGQQSAVNSVIGSSGSFGSASGRYPGRNFYYTYGRPDSSFVYKLGNGGSYSWSSGPRDFSFRLGGSASSSQLANTAKKFISGLGESRSN